MPSYTGNPTDALKALRATFPTPLGSRHGEFLIAACRTVGHGAGLLSKDSGTNVQLPSGRRVSQDWMVFPDGFGTDFLDDGEGKAKIQWGALQEYDKARYIDISGEVIGAPDPKPEPQDLSAILKSIEELRAELKKLRADHEDLYRLFTAAVSDLHGNIAAVASRKLRAKGNTSRTWGHGHAVDLEVISEG